MKIRSKAREVALQYLYQIDITRAHTDKTLSEFVDNFVTDTRVLPYAMELIQGVCSHLSTLDSMIDSVSDNWSVMRMASIDRNILRISAYELLYNPDIPYKVAINEGIELAKRFGSPNFPPFVNGVLDRLKDRKREI